MHGTELRHEAVLVSGLQGNGYCQIAAANPLYISRDQVPEADLAKEREIAAAAVAGKPPAVVQKIVDGKL